MTIPRFIRRVIRQYVKPGRREALGVVLGAEFIRGVVPSRQLAWSEPDLLIRRIVDRRILQGEKAIGRIAEQVLICRSRHLFEHVRVFDDAVPVDQYTLSRVFRYLRVGEDKPPGWCRPGRIAVTGRPDLLRQIEPVLQEAAWDAGFWECRAVMEHDCLAAALEVGSGESVVAIDIGHHALRLCAWQAGQLVFQQEDTSLSGSRLIEETCAAAGALGLAIGPLMARRIIEGHGDPAQSPMEIRGRDLATGLPRKLIDLPGLDIRLAAVFDQIASACRGVIGEVFGREAVRVELVGTGAIASLESSLRERLPGVPIHRQPDPGMTSAQGMMRLLTA